MNDGLKVTMTNRQVDVGRMRVVIHRTRRRAVGMERNGYCIVQVELFDDGFRRRFAVRLAQPIDAETAVVKEEDVFEVIEFLSLEV